MRRVENWQGCERGEMGKKSETIGKVNDRHATVEKWTILNYRTTENKVLHENGQTHERVVKRATNKQTVDTLFAADSKSLKVSLFSINHLRVCCFSIEFLSSWPGCPEHLLQQRAGWAAQRYLPVAWWSWQWDTGHAEMRAMSVGVLSWPALQDGPMIVK